MMQFLLKTLDGILLKRLFHMLNIIKIKGLPCRFDQTKIIRFIKF